MPFQAVQVQRLRLPKVLEQAVRGTYGMWDLSIDHSRLSASGKKLSTPVPSRQLGSRQWRKVSVNASHSGALGLTHLTCIAPKNGRKIALAAPSPSLLLQNRLVRLLQPGRPKTALQTEVWGMGKLSCRTRKLERWQRRAQLGGTAVRSARICSA